MRFFPSISMDKEVFSSIGKVALFCNATVSSRREGYSSVVLYHIPLYGLDNEQLYFCHIFRYLILTGSR